MPRRCTSNIWFLISIEKSEEFNPFPRMAQYSWFGRSGMHFLRITFHYFSYLERTMGKRIRFHLDEFPHQFEECRSQFSITVCLSSRRVNHVLGLSTSLWRTTVLGLAPPSTVPSTYSSRWGTHTNTRTHERIHYIHFSWIISEVPNKDQIHWIDTTACQIWYFCILWNWLDNIVFSRLVTGQNCFQEDISFTPPDPALR